MRPSVVVAVAVLAALFGRQSPATAQTVTDVQ